jgi:hypothetical protein
VSIFFSEDPQAARRSGRASRWRGRMTTQRSREYSGAKPLAAVIASGPGNCPQRRIDAYVSVEKFVGAAALSVGEWQRVIVCSVEKPTPALAESPLDAR